MKIAIPLLVTIGVALTSCTKSYFENRLEGTWKLEKAERASFIDWDDVPTGYESGVFTFFSNGTVTYRDGQLNMQGDWTIRKRTDRYTDSDGDDQHNDRFALLVHIYDFNAARVLNLDFDELHFRGRNRFLGKYRTPGYRYRYEFTRY